MSKLIPYIANANGILNKFVPEIEMAIRMAEEYVVPKLNIDYEINIVFASLADYIPEDHIGGYTYNASFITITLDKKVKKINVESIFETICHELCHAVRWSKNPEHTYSLVDAVIFEGLALAFENQALLDNKIAKCEFFLDYIKKIPEVEIKKVLNILKDQLDHSGYDRIKIFFKGDERLGLPRWAGYIVGYYIVQKYLKQTGKKPNEIYLDKYSEIKKVIKAI